MKKIICLVLSLIMIMGTLVLVSCAEGDKNKKPGEDIQIDPEDTYLTGLDFEGQVIKFALSSANSTTAIGYIGCDVEEKNGDSVVDAVYDRNQLVESRLNVKIEVVATSNHTKFTEVVLPALQAGDDEYDWLWGQQANDIDLCLDGYILDLNTLGDDVNYIDDEASWWATDYMNHYRYKTESYWLSGPLSLNYAGGADCIYVNSRLYDANFEATYGNIYDFVRAGKWTVDEMAKMSSLVYKDLDQNEKVSDADINGIRFADSWDIMRYLIGAGLEASSRNPDGSINFGITSTNNDYITRVQKLYSVMSTTEGMSAVKSPWYDRQNFSDGRQLFMFGSLSSMQNLREMEDDFYLIPLPKFDLDQTAYRASVADGNQIMGLAYTCQNIPAATATLELMAYLSEKSVTGLYFDEVLKYKYSRDDDTAEMVQLIHDSTYTDFVMIWEAWLFGEHWIRYDGFNPSITSTIKKSQTKWLQTFNDTLKALDNVPNKE